MDRGEAQRDCEGEHSRKLIVLGCVGRVHGVQGWVRLFSYTVPREAIFHYTNCFLHVHDEWRPARFAEGRSHGKALIARFDGVDDRDTAAGYSGAELAVARSDMPEPEAGHYYWADLQGLSVRQRDGRVLGQVESVLATGANDVLVVRGEREILVPFVMDKVILDVDLIEGVISVDWEWD